MTYSEALEYLDSLTNLEKEKSFQYPESLSLERMRRLVKALGNPQNAYPSILIAGSKGKGSVAALLSSILRMEDLKVGLYTSPHLLDVRERIQVNGLLISEVRFAEWVRQISKILEEYVWRKDLPTYFEVLTAIAFCHFKEMKAQAVVLEVGLGGLYDSTNVAEAKVVGMTPISLEHTDKLGKTISKIAVQKCGVIKGREYVVSSPQVRDAENVILQAAEAREARLYWVGRDIRLTERAYSEDRQKFDVKTPFGNYFDLSLHLLGEHQMENAALAVALAKCFEEKTRMKISEAAIKQGVLDARWPGRLEKLSEKPLVVVDGAHNRESTRRMLEGLKRHFHYSRLLVVLGVSEDKDFQGILEELFDDTEHFFLTRSHHPRSLNPKKLEEIVLGHGRSAEISNSMSEAYEKASQRCTENDLLLVTGSLYLVSEARELLR